MKTRYPKLLSPLQVGNVTLKNRIITGPMSIVELDPKGGYTEQGIAFYEGLAAGGAALITPGGEHCGQQQRDDPPPADPV